MRTATNEKLFHLSCDHVARPPVAMSGMMVRVLGLGETIPRIALFQLRQLYPRKCGILNAKKHTQERFIIYYSPKNEMMENYPSHVLLMGGLVDGMVHRIGFSTLTTMNQY